jgi:5-methylthioadenosine/S-adenosylhomocysteine deaminase
MALVIAGRIVPLDRAHEGDVFKGRVWLGDDGLIDTVTKDGAAAPAGFAQASIVDVGDAWVLPGLIDLHNHIGYNALPLWSEPKQKTAFLHHNSWTGAPTYQAAISWPSGVLAFAEPEALLAYVQLRALAGGTTAIQGWPVANRQHVQVLRDIDEEGKREAIYTSALTKDPAGLAKMAQAQLHGAGFIYHCAEGQLNSIVAREFTDVANAGCLLKTFIGIHCNAVAGGEWQRWTTAQAGTVVWSPFSNLWLYGSTTIIPAVRDQNIRVSLGSDWGPSGTKHVLGELKVAKLVSQEHSFGLSDRELVKMVTANPGDALAQCWSRTIGRLVPGGYGDVTVLRSKGNGDVWSQVVAATEKEVMLVVYNSLPRYGDAKAMLAARPTVSSPLTVKGIARRFAIPDPDDATTAWSWAAITKRLDVVRKDPAGAVARAKARHRAFAGRWDAEQAPLELALDMPSGPDQARAGGVPKDPEHVVIPPLPSLVHDRAFFAAIHGHGFHTGLLDGLARFYQ